LNRREKAFIVIVAAAFFGMFLMDDDDWEWVAKVMAARESANVKYESTEA